MLVISIMVIFEKNIAPVPGGFLVDCADRTSGCRKCRLRLVIVVLIRRDRIRGNRNGFSSTINLLAISHLLLDVAPPLLRYPDNLGTPA